MRSNDLTVAMCILLLSAVLLTKAQIPTKKTHNNNNNIVTKTNFEILMVC